MRTDITRISVAVNKRFVQASKNKINKQININPYPTNVENRVSS